MKFNPKFVRALALALFVLAGTGLVWANGEEFFESPTDTTPSVYYFGHIKDNNGKVLTGALVDVAVTGQYPYTSTVATDSPGHYRTTTFPITLADSGKVQITARMKGYRQMTPATANAPKRGSSKAIEVDFVMVPDSGK